MGVYEGRHDGLAREIDTRGVSRRSQIALAANLREPPVRDDECGVFNGGAAVDVDEPRAFVDGRTWRSLCEQDAERGCEREDPHVRCSNGRSSRTLFTCS